MVKHEFLVEGVTPDGFEFSDKAIDSDIIKLIEAYRDARHSVHHVKRCEQVRADSKIGIMLDYKVSNVRKD